jgi:hypothetical protein
MWFALGNKANKAAIHQQRLALLHPFGGGAKHATTTKPLFGNLLASNDT